MTTASQQQLGPNERRIAHNVEEILLSRMENLNPVPSNAAESQNLDDFLGRYATIIEPSEPFTRRMLAFLETMDNQQYREQQRRNQREQRVQVTRVGAKRVFGTDITYEMDQNRNIANNVIA